MVTATVDVLPPNAFIPTYFTNMGDDAIDLAAVCGLFLDDWQQEILRCSLGYGEGGRFSARQMLLLVPRQQGKNIILEARELAGLFLLHEKVMAHTAQEQRTAISSYRRLKEHIENGKRVLPHFDKIRWLENTTEISVSLPTVEGGSDPRSSSRLIFAPRTSNSLRGLTVELLVVDEAYAYTADHAAAIEPTQNAARNPQLWLTSSTGMPESTELLAKREIALSGQLPNLGFFEYKSDDGSDPGDEVQWSKALPGIRTGRTQIEDIRAQYLKAKTHFRNGTGDFTEFDREIRGLWASVDMPSTIPDSLWQSMQYPAEYDWVPPSEFAFAVSVSPTYEGSSEQFTSIYAVGKDENGFAAIWNVAAEPGITWVAEFLKSAQEKHSPRVTVIDPQSPAGALLPMFEEYGVQFTSLTSSQCMAACSQFLAFAMDGRLRHGVDDLLREAVGLAVQRFSGGKGSWFWMGKNPGDNVTPVVAATYALFALSGVDPVEGDGGWFW